MKLNIIKQTSLLLANDCFLTDKETCFGFLSSVVTSRYDYTFVWNSRVVYSLPPSYSNIVLYSVRYYRDNVLGPFLAVI